MSLSITFLGTGGSSGTPQIGCSCKTCLSTDTRNKRLRPSICIHYNSANIVIDTSPEFRMQMLDNNITHLDGIIYTHGHADHIMGLADIRPFNFSQNSPVPVYADPVTLGHIKNSFSFMFNAPEEFKKYYPQATVYNINGPFEIKGLTFIPLTVYHYKMPVQAFRFDNCAYITDVNTLPEECFDQLKGLDCLILEAFQFEKHISHFSLEEAVEIARRIEAKRTFLTHISHDIEHEYVSSILPSDIKLAYDGLNLKIY